MRGKSIDSDFVSNYIIKCASIGKTSSKEICIEAQSRISDIDEKIKSLEIEKNNLKNERIKLMDVLNSFNFKNSENLNNIDTNITFITMDKSLLKNIKNFLDTQEKITLDQIMNLSTDKSKAVFSIKQFVQFEVLQRVENSFLKGKKWSDYISKL